MGGSVGGSEGSGETLVKMEECEVMVGPAGAVLAECEEEVVLAAAPDHAVPIPIPARRKDPIDIEGGTASESSVSVLQVQVPLASRVSKD